MSEVELRTILEACFADLEAGRAPDLDELCGGRPDLRARVEGILATEQRLVQACAPSVAERVDVAAPE